MHRQSLPLLLLLAGLAGCATPRYETVTLREAPGGEAGQACVQACAERLEACKGDCALRYQDCLKRGEPEALEHYRKTLDRYAADLEDYQRDIARYRMQLWMNWGWGYAPYWHDPWPFAYYVPPPPRPPARAAVVKRFLEQRCGGDCGCQAPYDTCFVACGGRITNQQRCVRNCPDTH
ncbi:MAG: hypothetical protein AB1831_08270 [Pseudomonadota bacterium]